MKSILWLLPIFHAQHSELRSVLHSSGNPSHSLEACFLSSTWLDDLGWPQAAPGIAAPRNGGRRKGGPRNGGPPEWQTQTPADTQDRHCSVLPRHPLLDQAVRPHDGGRRWVRWAVRRGSRACTGHSCATADTSPSPWSTRHTSINSDEARKAKQLRRRLERRYRRTGNGQESDWSTRLPFRLLCGSWYRQHPEITSRPHQV